MVNRTVVTAVAIVTLYLVAEKAITLFWSVETDEKMLLRKKKLGRYTVGLTNRANDCFANSDLQALAAIPVFYEWVKAINASSEVKKPLCLAMEQMICALNEPIMKPKSLSAWQLLLIVVERIHRSRISRSQHDAHELLHLVLETLENELRTMDEKRSFPFRGETSDIITCSRCGYSPPPKVSSFLVLSVMVPQKKKCDLSALLDTMTSPEIIDGYGCSKCRLLASGNPELISQYKEDPDKIPDGLLPASSVNNAGSTITKRTSFHWLPSVLAIHLSRSIYYADQSGGASRNSCKVAYPEYLDVFSEQLPGEGSKGLEPSLDTLDTLGVLRRSKKIYKLVAMIRHKGTHQAGHYECYRRKDFNWFAAVNQNQSPGQSQNQIQIQSNGSASAEAASGPTGTGTKNGEPTGERTGENTGERTGEHTGAPTGDTNGNGSTNLSLGEGSSPSLSSASTSASTLESGSSATSEPSAGHLSASYSVQSTNGSTPPLSNGVLPFPARSSPAISMSEAQSRPGSISSPTFTPISSYPWWRISDEKVWECSTKEVLKEESGVYLLFYQETSS